VELKRSTLPTEDTFAALNGNSEQGVKGKKNILGILSSPHSLIIILSHFSSREATHQAYSNPV